MAVYYKFKSAKDYDSIPVDGHFISVAYLKEKIFECKHLGRGTDFDLVVTNAQSNEEYLDEAMLIPKNTSVLIRRVPGRPRMPIVTEPVIEQDKLKTETNKSDDAHLAKSSFVEADLSVTKYPDDSEWDEFGNDLYAISEVLPVQASNPFQDATPPSKADEDSKIKALIDTPALDWQRQISDGFGPGRSFGRGMGGRMMGGRGFGRGGLERKTPPQGYVCHRCKLPGHFIQHCPTNGDPTYDIKRTRPPTGIPKSMLIATPDGSYALPSGAVAVLNPNEAAFEKEIEGLPSTRSVGDLPPELHCPLCKEVMKDAVLTSKCCFESFCDRCIRDQIISKLMCVCGAINVLADDLLPNKTLRDTINRILESNNSSADNAGTAFHVQDKESKIRGPKVESKVSSPPLSADSKGGLIPQPQNVEMAKVISKIAAQANTKVESKVPSPLSEASKGGQIPQPQKVEMAKVSETAAQANTVNARQKTSEKECTGKLPDVSEATHDSRSGKEPVSLGCALLADEMQQKPVSGDTGKKKKKKKTRSNDMQWTIPQGFAAENHMMPLGPSAYNPYWTGMQPGMEGYLAPYGGPLPCMGFGHGPLDIPFGALPQDPFGMQGYTMPPVPPQRDLAAFGMGFNARTPIMSRAQFEAPKAELRRKREIEKWDERERELGREVRSGQDVSSLKSKSNSPPTGEHLLHRHRPERSPEHHARDPLPRPPLKRKLAHDRDDYDHRDRDQDYHRGHHHNHRCSESAAAMMPEQVARSMTTDRKQKVSVFSRISFPEKEQTAAAAAAVSKKRKVSSSEALVGDSSAASSARQSHKVSANGYLEDRNTTSSLKKASAAAAADYESSDDERHFKRRPSKCELSAEAARHSRGSREKDRDWGNRDYHR